jgi:hypothetical protein
MVVKGVCAPSHDARRHARLKWHRLLGWHRRSAAAQGSADARHIGAGRVAETFMTWSNLDIETIVILAILGVLVVLTVVAWVAPRGNPSERLQQRFGPEYARVLEQLGSREKAEAELLARERRVKRLRIVALTPAAAARYAQMWMRVQGRFVDSPRGALVEADRLVRELMLQRGYPMGNFERRAADISVDHPAVVDHYRAAHEIVLRDRRDATDTEELRKALVHYRALFDELLEVAPTAAGWRRHSITRHMEARS